MIASINPENFLKCQRSIEKRNLVEPSPKILVMDRGQTSTNSHVSGLLLRAYYAKLERNPKIGLSDLDFDLLIKNHMNENDKIECCYCKQDFSEKDITIDHFKPKVFKGANQYFNLRLSCKNCNETKGGIYPQRMPIAFNLFQQKIKDGEKIQCLNILLEVKDKMIDLVDEIELSLLNRLIGMELKWRSLVNEKKKLKMMQEDAA